MRGFILSAAASLLIMAAQASEPLTVRLYPNGAPDSNAVTAEETNINDRLRNVTDPRLLVYVPEGECTGQFVVICPGGGYEHVTMAGEGYEVAEWLNGKGIAAGVLAYRTPNGHASTCINDVRRAVEMVRENAQAWKADPKKVGVMGFSAGGHLAAMAVTKYTSEQNRPDFGILVYPVITFVGPTHRGSVITLLGNDPSESELREYSAELLVNAQTPTCFVALCDDDMAVPANNGVSFYMALKNAGVRGELHVYPKGGHGWGFTGPQFTARAEFEASLSRWLTSLNSPEPQRPPMGFGRPGQMPGGRQGQRPEGQR